MSVEEFDQFGPDHFAKAPVHHMQALPETAHWPDDREPSPETKRGWPFKIPPFRFPQRGPKWLWQIVLMTLLISAIGSGGMLYYLDQTFAGLIYPNVFIQGLPVGQLPPEEANTQLQTIYADFLEQPVTLTYGDQTWTPSLEDLGVQVEIEATVEQALATGRRQGFIQNLRQVATIWQNGLDIPLHVSVDQAAMQEYLLARAAEVDRPTRDAQLMIQGTLMRTRAAVPGHQLLVQETIQDTLAAVQTLQPQTVVLRTRELPPLMDNAAVAEARQEAEKILQGPIILKANDQEWEWSQNDLAAMLRVERIAGSDGSSDELKVGLDPFLMQRRLRAIAEKTNQPSVHPRVNWNNGNLEIFRDGVPGRQLDMARASQMVLAATARPNRTLVLPFTVDEHTITEATIDQLSIPDLLSLGQSDFTGSAGYRITNITAGMNLLHGILLAPDEEFSFNNNIGAINAANGFVEGYAIIQNRTQLEWGGGICQDSTTMFRAAFWAGLPITERHGHSFYINWYDKYGYGEYGDGPGMDAAIFTGGPDLKFVNDTGNWLLIQTYVDPARTLAEVRIYGTKSDRTVELEGPTITDRAPPPPEPVYVVNPDLPLGAVRQTDTARGGMTINFTRIIKEDGVEVDRETFVTRFKPWPNIFETNPVNTQPRPAEEETEAEPEAPAEESPAAPPAEPAAPPEPVNEPVTVAPPGDVGPIVQPGDVAPVVP